MFLYLVYISSFFITTLSLVHFIIKTKENCNGLSRFERLFLYEIFRETICIKFLKIDIKIKRKKTVQSLSDVEAILW